MNRMNDSNETKPDIKLHAYLKEEARFSETNPMTSTEELEARLDRLRTRAASVHDHIRRLTEQHDALLNYICDTIFTLEARERRDFQAKCKHEDFTENLTGRTCRECGLETK